MQSLAVTAARPHMFPHIPTPLPTACDSLPVMPDFARSWDQAIGKTPGQHEAKVFLGKEVQWEKLP